MKLSQKDVLKIARLARLELSESEVERYSIQLSAILDYVEKLETLNVRDIEPTAHAVSVPTPFREDEMVQEAVIEKVLEAAPDCEDRFFKVPKVIS